jgi:hypothetical protein
MCGQEVPVTDKVCQKEFDEWQAREKRWRENRRAWGNYLDYKGLRVPRVKRANPPAWVERFCEPELAVGAVMRLSLVCEAYDDYLEYDWTQHVEGPNAAITFSKQVSQGGSADRGGFLTYLLKHLHYDGAWTNSENGSRAYGLFGTHLTFAHTGRFYLWGPPGILVLRRPEGKVELRMTYGVDILVADLPLPFKPGFKLPLYLSVAKAFDTHEEKAIRRRVNAGMDMVGFSVTFKR